VKFLRYKVQFRELKIHKMKWMSFVKFNTKIKIGDNLFVIKIKLSIILLKLSFLYFQLDY